MKQNNYLVTSDIHGCHNQLIELLSKWDQDNETLVILGDLVDRGPESLLVIRTLMDLKEKHPEGVIVLQGNHDADFVSWVRSGENAGVYYSPYLKETVASFYAGNEERLKKDTLKNKANFLRRNFQKEISFLSNLPLFHETEHCIFVHAGIDPDASDWRDDTYKTFLWIREEFYHSPKSFEKRVFFGHTPTVHLHEDMTNFNVWLSRTGDKVGIDGACVFGGQLNAIRIDPKGKILEKIKIEGLSREGVS